MTGKLTLYRDCKVIEGENFKVTTTNMYDLNFGQYLASLTKVEYNDIKFEQGKLDIEVKIPATPYEASINDFSSTPHFNYVQIYYTESSKIMRGYYFVRKREAIAMGVVKLSLHLDVLNTFSENVDYTFSPLTHILRQHKDRFKQAYIYEQGYFYYPHIDEYSEGINPVLYKKTYKSIKFLTRNYEISNRWYLIYYSSDATGVVCYFVPETAVTIKVDLGDDYYDYRNLMTFDQIDLTKSELIKVIELPYAPFDLEDDGNGDLIISDTTNYVTATNEFQSAIGNWVIKKYAVSSRFAFNNTTNIKDNPLELNPLRNINMNNDNLAKSLSDLRSTYINNDFEEPKLFHSDFFYWKYVYDSFVKVVKNESYLNTYSVNNSTIIEYYVTQTINSRFMFKFNFDEYHFNTEDYASYLIIQRNNEKCILNNEYLNYIRTGFNYDVKNKNRQESMSWLTTGVGITAGLLSVAFGSKTLGAGLIASSVLAIANSINNTIQLETNIEQKMAQLKSQSASVYGADDVDLMQVYNDDDQLWRAKYEVSDRMKKALKDLFFYTGYVDDTNAIPTHNNRMWFDYLQCEPHFSKCSIPQECKEELINLFKGGVTYIHPRKVNNVAVFDFDRIHENWEAVFFN